MTHGLIPAAAISMIFRRIWLGKGRPLMKTPPSWLTRPWPESIKPKNENKLLKTNFALIKDIIKRFLYFQDFQIV